MFYNVAKGLIDLKDLKEFAASEKNVEQKGKSEPIDVSKYRLNGNVEPVAGDPSTTEVLREFLNLFPDERIRSNIIKMFGSSRWVNVSEEYSL